MNTPQTVEVTISIVTWNSADTIMQCLESIFSQTYTSYEVVVFDNASTDRTLEKVSSRPPVHCISSKRNTGYSAAHNAVIREARGDFVLCMNADVVLTPSFLEKLVRYAHLNPRLASLGGKVLRTDTLEEVPRTAILDATGLVLLKSFRAVNRGEGELDNGQYDHDGHVFGHSGSVVLFRKSSLERVKVFGEYFDEDFFAYKEDVDLAWRLQSAGWSSWYVHGAIAYHLRSVRRGVRHSQSLAIKRLSYRNHLLMLIKNMDIRDMLIRSPWILSYELGKFLILLVTDIRVLFSLGRVIKLIPRTWEKHKAISQLARM